VAEFVSIGMSAASGPLIKLHSHDDTWEILFYTGGTGVVTVGRQAIPFAPGRIVFMPPRVEHAERGAGEFACIYLQIKRFSCPPGRVPSYDDDPSGSAQTLARMINREFHLRHPNWQRVTQELLDLLLLYFKRWDAARPSDPMVDELRSLMAENMHDPDFDIGVALDRMPVSSEHMRRVFKKDTDKTPLQFLMDMRVEEARQLLADGALNVKQVAQRVGIRDALYFSRLFTRSTGVSPREYARRMRC
jgi:AraC-like DNA-binding protein